jgi:hypothetical protein
VGLELLFPIDSASDSSSLSCLIINTDPLVLTPDVVLSNLFLLDHCYCICEVPACGSLRWMIICKQCKHWFHLYCLQLMNPSLRELAKCNFKRVGYFLLSVHARSRPLF